MKMKSRQIFKKSTCLEDKIMGNPGGFGYGA